MPDDSEVPQTQAEGDKLIGRLFLSRPAGKLTLGCLIISTFFFAFESVPGWSFWDLGFSPEAYVILCGCTGLLAGFVGAERRFVGAIAAGLSGAGGIMAIVTLLSWVSRIPNLAILLAMVVGVFPGIALYWLSEQILGRPRQGLESSANEAGGFRRSQGPRP